MRILKICFDENNAGAGRHSSEGWIVTRGHAGDVCAMPVSIARSCEIGARQFETVAAFGHSRSAQRLVPDAQDASGERWMPRIYTGVNYSDNDALPVQVIGVAKLRDVHACSCHIHARAPVTGRDNPLYATVI